MITIDRISTKLIINGNPGVEELSVDEVVIRIVLVLRPGVEEAGVLLVEVKGVVDEVVSLIVGDELGGGRINSTEMVIVQFHHHYGL